MANSPDIETPFGPLPLSMGIKISILTLNQLATLSTKDKTLPPHLDALFTSTRAALIQLTEGKP